MVTFLNGVIFVIAFIVFIFSLPRFLIMAWKEFSEPISKRDEEDFITIMLKSSKFLALAIASIVSFWMCVFEYFYFFD